LPSFHCRSDKALRARQVQNWQKRLSAAETDGKGHSMSDDILARYRDSIDNIDAALVFMLAERFKVTQAVGEYKATAQLPPADLGREERQVERLRQLARDAKLDPDFTEKFLRFIIDEVIRHHEKIRAES
jgi:chorismate mutase